MSSEFTNGTKARVRYETRVSQHTGNEVDDYDFTLAEGVTVTVIGESISTGGILDEDGEKVIAVQAIDPEGNPQEVLIELDNLETMPVLH